MAFTVANIASKVLRDIQLPEDTSTPSIQALADAKLYVGERARKIWEMRLWGEFIILGTYSVPVGATTIALSAITASAGYNTAANGYSATFSEVSAIREGSNPLLPEDPAAINAVQADLWAATTSPVRFVNRGQQGITLLGSYSAATTLSFFGKSDFVALADSDTFILNCENALIAGATADMLKYHERDFNRAGAMEQVFDDKVASLMRTRELQGANIKRIIPLSPWTGYNLNQNIDTSKTGSGLYY